MKTGPNTFLVTKEAILEAAKDNDTQALESLLRYPLIVRIQDIKDILTKNIESPSLYAVITLNRFVAYHNEILKEFKTKSDQELVDNSDKYLSNKIFNPNCLTQEGISFLETLEADKKINFAALLHEKNRKHVDLTLYPAIAVGNLEQVKKVFTDAKKIISMGVELSDEDIQTMKNELKKALNYAQKLENQAVISAIDNYLKEFSAVASKATAPAPKPATVPTPKVATPAPKPATVPAPKVATPAPKAVAPTPTFLPQAQGAKLVKDKDGRVVATQNIIQKKIKPSSNS